MTLIHMEGGGHRLPGREERSHRLVDQMLGPQNHDFEAAEAVWGFFNRPANR